MDNGLLFHLLIKFFIPWNYLIMKKGSFLCREGTVVREEEKQNIIWQMAWTIPFLLTFAVIPLFPVLAPVFNTMALMLLWGYKGGINSGVLSLSFPLFFSVIRCAASRRASGEGVLCSGYSRLLYVDLLCCCCQSLNLNRIMESWNGLGWTFKDHLVQPPLPRSGTSSSRSCCSRPRPTSLWTLWITPRLLWPFSLLRLTELTGWVAWSLCKTFLSILPLLYQTGATEKELVWGCLCALRLDLTFVLCCNSRKYLSLLVL